MFGKFEEICPSVEHTGNKMACDFRIIWLMEGDHNNRIYWKQMAPNVIHGCQDDVLIVYMNLDKPLIWAFELVFWVKSPN